MFSFELLINALVIGILLGGFYAALSIGLSISFGLLDIVNIAHPAFIILGAFICFVLYINCGVVTIDETNYQLAWRVRCVQFVLLPKTDG